MGIIDILIIIFIVLGFIKGFSSGMIKRAVSLIGLILVIILSFWLKNYLSMFFYENLPFISLSGIFKGVESINIIFYEFLAFFIVLSVLMIAFRIVVFASGVINKIVNCTIILTLPNKLIGGIIGVVEVYIYIFLILLITSSFSINNSFIKDNSILEDKILNNTPILSEIGSSMIDTVNEVIGIKDKYDDKNNSNSINLEVIDVLLDKKIVTINSIEKLIEKDKLKVEGIDIILNKYRK